MGNTHIVDYTRAIHTYWTIHGEYTHTGLYMWNTHILDNTWVIHTYWTIHG